MGFYRSGVYPWLVSVFGDPAPIQAARRKLLSAADGVVLEVGIGAGANLPHYDRTRVTKLFGLEPNRAMLRRAKQRTRGIGIDVEFLDLPGERIPLGDASIDCVVSTFTLCTISGVDQALRGIRRVLKPGGGLLFLEISVAADAGIRRWQHRWEPTFHRLFEGLYLTRDIPELLGDAGFVVSKLETGSMSRFPRSWSHCCWGTALA
jgi:ubiquinone/menaquinone biosynthesis C-methylase UbiE